MFIVTSLGAAFGACTQYRAYNGDECLKDEDCLGGTCVAYTCTAPAPTFTGNPPAVDSGGQADTGSTTPGADGDDVGGEDAGEDGPAPVDAAHDSTVVVDSGQDAADTSTDQPDAADAADAENDVTLPFDGSDDASDDADDASDAATGARETRPDSLLA